MSILEMTTLATLHQLPYHAWFDAGEQWCQQPDCYPMYTAAAKVIRPESILEIGAFEGLGLVSFILGYEPQTISWIDNESYGPNTNQRCRDNLEQLRCQGYTRFRIRDVAYTLHAAQRRHYDLVHIDGDHSYAGSLLSLVWAYAHCSARVMLVDDATNAAQWPEVRRACDAFADAFDFPYRLWCTNRGWAVFSRETLPDSLEGCE